MTRLVSWALGRDKASPGYVLGEEVYDAARAWAAAGVSDAAPMDVAAWLELLGGLDADRWRALLAVPHGPSVGGLGDVQLSAPVRPGKIVGVGLNYQTHAAEADRELPAHPMLFAKLPNTVAGPVDPIRIPRVSHRIDYEGELGVVIGRGGRYIPRPDAMAHVGGYLVANDVSARDYQMRTREMLQGKSFDGFAPMGPWVITPDEVGDLRELRLRTWVVDDLRQDATLGEMIFPVDHLVAYISDIMTLEPGDVILTGTPAGIGATMDPRRWLRAGDAVTVEIERVGRIRNVVEAEEPGP